MNDNLPQMKLHTQIEADGNDKALYTLTQFVDWLQDTHTVTPKKDDSNTQPLHTRAEFTKLAFEFLEYDYDAWMAEKDELVKHLNEEFRQGKTLYYFTSDDEEFPYEDHDAETIFAEGLEEAQRFAKELANTHRLTVQIREEDSANIVEEVMPDSI